MGERGFKEDVGEDKIEFIRSGSGRGNIRKVHWEKGSGWDLGLRKLPQTKYVWNAIRKRVVLYDKTSNKALTQNYKQI